MRNESTSRKCLANIFGLSVAFLSAVLHHEKNLQGWIKVGLAVQLMETSGACSWHDHMSMRLLIPFSFDPIITISY